MAQTAVRAVVPHPVTDVRENSRLCIRPWHTMMVPSQAQLTKVIVMMQEQQEELRQSVLQSRKVDACRKCITLYSNGIHSEEARKPLPMFMKEPLHGNSRRWDTRLRQKCLQSRTPECLALDRCDALVNCRIAHAVACGIAGALAGGCISGMIGGLSVLLAGVVGGSMVVISVDR